MAENLDRRYLPIPIFEEGIKGVDEDEYITDVVSNLLMDVPASYVGARYTLIQRTHVSPYASEPSQVDITYKN